jgi:methylornithine synthase
MSIEEILNRASEGNGLEDRDIQPLVEITDPKEIEMLFETAREVRNKVSGDKVAIYGFVYFSTYCKNNCAFCYYRQTNGELPRYRKTKDEVVDLSIDLVEAGVNLVDLTMGEDPRLYANGYEQLLDLVSSVRGAIGKEIGIMVSPGALDKDAFPKVREAGGDWYACYQETNNRQLFEKLRLGQDYDFRLNQKKWAKDAGLLTEEGILVGVGETAADRAQSIREMRDLGCRQVRAMTFVPQTGTPMQNRSPSDSLDERMAIAVMRLAYPDRLIPCSLDVEGIDGLVSRIDAGANVITSIVPPHMNLAGVAQHDLDIDNGNRSVGHVKDMLADMGFRVPSNSEYRTELENWRSA